MVLLNGIHHRGPVRRLFPDDGEDQSPSKRSRTSVVCPHAGMITLFVVIIAVLELVWMRLWLPSAWPVAPIIAAPKALQTHDALLARLDERLNTVRLPRSRSASLSNAAQALDGLQRLEAATAPGAVTGNAISLRGVDSKADVYGGAVAQGEWVCTMAGNYGVQLRLPLSSLNDEYCDCADGSDEPGTSACAGVAERARFHCRGMVLAASRIDDGVCDCCDGTDERGDICPNDCAALDAAAAAKQARLKNGRRFRTAMEEKVRRQPALLAAAGGHGAAYGALSGICVRSDSSEYTYEVCLYKGGARQTPKHGGSRFSLGRHWSWESGDNTGDARGVFLGGDRCGSVERSLHVQFVCAPGEDRLGRVQEVQTCQYEVSLETAAAC